MSKYYSVNTYTGEATPVERRVGKCEAIVKGWRATNYVGEVPVQCSRWKAKGDYCEQHAKRSVSNG